MYLFGSLVVFMALVFTSNVFAESISMFSDVEVICADQNQGLEITLTVPGKIERQGRNQVHLKLQSDLWNPTARLRNGITTQALLFPQTGSFSWSFSDPFQYQYQLRISKEAFFRDDAHTQATLERYHTDPDVDERARYVLHCITAVHVTPLTVAPINATTFAHLTPDAQAAFLGSVINEDHTWNLSSWFEVSSSEVSEEKREVLLASVELCDALDADDISFEEYYGYGPHVTQFRDEMMTLAVAKREELQAQWIERMLGEYGADEVNQELEDELREFGWFLSSLFIIVTKSGDILGAVVTLENDNASYGSWDDEGIHMFYDISKTVIYEREFSY